VANIGKLPDAESVWAASTSAHRLTVRSYGKSGLHLDMENDPQSGAFRTLVLKSTTNVLVEYDWVGTITVHPLHLNSANLPYVNAFIGEAGEVRRDWRAAKAGATDPSVLYRLQGDGNRYRKASDWVLRQSGAAIQPGSLQAAAVSGALTNALAAKVAAAVQQAATQPAPPIHINPNHPNAPQQTLPGIQTTQVGGVTKASFTEDPWNVAQAGPIVEPTRPEPDPVIVERTEPLPLPAGWVGIPHRGETLAIPERVVGAFEAALHVRRAQARPHFILAVGPTGSGKTEGMIALAERAGYEVIVVDCAGFETSSDVYGAVEPDETGRWTRLPSVFWRGLERAAADEDRQYVIVLDELTRSKPAAQNAFIAPLAGQKALTNPVTGAKVLVGPNVTIIATANIGAAYSGTEALDAALASRFAVRLNIGYLPREVEQSVVESIGLPVKDAETLARLAEDLRAIDKTQPFRSALVPGTRDVVQVARQAMFDPLGLQGAWDVCVIERFSDEGRDPMKTERARAAFAAGLSFEVRHPEGGPVS